MMRRYIVRPALVLPVVYLMLMLCACAQKNPNLVTPQGQSAAKNTDIVKRVGELQSVTIQAHADKQVTDADADEIVKWTVATNKLLGTNPPNGWQVTAKTGWASAKARALKYPKLAIYVPLIDALLVTP